MSKQTTSIRLDPQLHKQVVQAAQKSGLSFSSIVHLLLHAFVEGSVHIGVTQYPKEYLQSLDKDVEELRKLRRKGKIKQYESSRALFDDILDR